MKMSFIFSALFYLCLAYIAAVIGMYFMQDKLAFPAHQTDYAPPQVWQLPGAQKYSLSVEEGVSLKGILYEVEVKQSPLFLTFHGNAHDGVRYATFIKGVLDSMNVDAHVLGLRYRGYGNKGFKSDGKPSQKTVLADALKQYDAMVQKYQPSAVYVVGYSMGSSVAAYVGSQRKVAGLLLTTPFDSIQAIAKGQYPWLPVSLLFKHPFPTKDFMAEQKTPTVVVNAGVDLLIPRPHYEELKPHIQNLVLEKEIKNAGHGDVLDDTFLPETTAYYKEAIRLFLKEK